MLLLYDNSKIMVYTHYTSYQFAQDTFFQSWVLYPNKENQAFWEQWLKDHPEKHEEVALAKKVILGWQFEEPEVSQVEVRLLRSKIMTRVQAVPPFSKKDKLSHIPLLKVAASVVVLFTLTSLLYWYIQPDRDWITHQTKFGEVKIVVLPDSSEVTLNANSSIRYLDEWPPKSERNVWLEGEAFFKVTKRPSLSDAQSFLKFTVHAKQLGIQVLGTRFNVYNRKSKTEVVLQEGSVSITVEDNAISAPGQDLRMEPGEKVTYHEKSLSRQHVNPDDFTSWKDGRLVFDAISLEQVARTIEETYGVDVQFASPTLSEKVFTGTVPSTDLEVLLDALRGIYDLEIRREQERIVFRQKE